MKNLPEDVIVEILLWLPAKSLLRFRSVSKSWLSLISDPRFTESHFQRHSTKHTDNRILLITFSEVRSINLSSSLLDDSAVTTLDFPFSESPVRVLIMGSCRGFLLLFDNDSKLSLWNPTTGKSKRIPHSPLWINVFLYGFCYDPSKDDYFIVQASYNPNSSLSVTQIEIFSVKTNLWKNLGPLNCANYINLGNEADPRAGLILNGAIHWIVLRVDGPDSSNGVIITFDLAEESLNEVPMPDDFNDKFSYFTDLRVLGGRLSLIDMNCWHATDVWMMGEYGVKSSWMKSIIVSTDEIPGRYFSPICLTEDGEVLGTDRGGELVKCNEIGQVTEYYEYCCDRMGYWAGSWAAASIYTESLLSLPNEG